MVRPLMNPSVTSAVFRRAHQYQSRLIRRYIHRARPPPMRHSKTLNVFSQLAARIHGATRNATAANKHRMRMLFRRPLAVFLPQITAVRRAVQLPHGPVRHALDGTLGRKIARSLSPVFQGAAQAFTALKAAPAPGAQHSFAFAQRINLSRHPLVSFARPSTRTGSGSAAFGPRPTPLPRSPFHGPGLQTARNFSSSSRVFDNLVFNAPLALRLAADQAQEKRKHANALALPPHLAPAHAPRRTAAFITPAVQTRQAVQLGRRACAAHPHKLAAVPDLTKPNAEAEAKAKASASFPVPAASAASAASSVISDSDYSELLSTYFHFPVWTPHVRLTIRLSEPLETILGHPPHRGATDRLFDAAFLSEAHAVHAFEQTRYLKARAVLRALYDAGLLDSAHIDHSDQRYLITIHGAQVHTVQSVLDAHCAFAHEFVHCEQVALPSGMVVQDDDDHEDGLELPLSQDEVDLDSALDQHGVLVSPPSSAELSSAPVTDDDDGSLLYDSREFAPR